MKNLQLRSLIYRFLIVLGCAFGSQGCERGQALPNNPQEELLNRRTQTIQTEQKGGQPMRINVGKISCLVPEGFPEQYVNTGLNNQFYTADPSKPDGVTMNGEGLDVTGEGELEEGKTYQEWLKERRENVYNVFPRQAIESEETSKLDNHPASVFVIKGTGFRTFMVDAQASERTHVQFIYTVAVNDERGREKFDHILGTAKLTRYGEANREAAPGFMKREFKGLVLDVPGQLVTREADYSGELELRQTKTGVLDNQVIIIMTYYNADKQKYIKNLPQIVESNAKGGQGKILEHQKSNFKNAELDGKKHLYRVEYDHSPGDNSPYDSIVTWIFEGKLRDGTTLHIKGETSVFLNHENLPRLRAELEKGFHELLSSIKLQEEPTR